MNTVHRRGFAAALLMLAAAGAGSVVFAESGQNGYPSNGVVAVGYFPNRATAAFRTSEGVADPTTVAGITSSTTNRRVAVLGKPSVSVGARFVDASTTCVVRLLYVWTDPNTSTMTAFDLSGPQTITATAFTDAGSKYIGPAVTFDSAGATHVYVVIVTPPATHTCDLWVSTW